MTEHEADDEMIKTNLCYAHLHTAHSAQRIENGQPTTPDQNWTQMTCQKKNDNTKMKMKTSPNSTNSCIKWLCLLDGTLSGHLKTTKPARAMTEQTHTMNDLDFFLQKTKTRNTTISIQYEVSAFDRNHLDHLIAAVSMLFFSITRRFSLYLSHSIQFKSFRFNA